VNYALFSKKNAEIILLLFSLSFGKTPQKLYNKTTTTTSFICMV